MTNQEYTDALAAAKAAYDDERKKIVIKYAQENNPVHIGDVVSNWNQTYNFKVERIEFCDTFSYPECRYFGTRLKKDGTPHKIQRGEYLLQSNVSFINGKPYNHNHDGN